MTRPRTHTTPDLSPSVTHDATALFRRGSVTPRESVGPSALGLLLAALGLGALLVLARRLLQD